ncbi:hypothetical protein AB2F98_01620 [Escherichia coli]
MGRTSSTFGVSRNDHLISCMGIAGAPEPSYLYAATLCAVAQRALSIDPARPLQTLTLPEECRLRWGMFHLVRT